MQLESVSLGRRDLGVAFSWSLFNWIADVACLAFAAYAAGDHASVAGLTVAYAAARAVGTIPLMPGGLLVVEAVLVPGLVSSGMSLPNAISAMLIYRLISWLLISAIGWVVFFFVFRTEKAGDSDDDSPTGPLPVLRCTAPSDRPVRDAALQGPLPPRIGSRNGVAALADGVAAVRVPERCWSLPASSEGGTGGSAGGATAAGRQPAGGALRLLHQAHGLRDLIGSLHCVDSPVSGCAIDVMSTATLGLASK